MKIPWSISTTVRAPERVREFLRILKILENQKFDKKNQVKYQILLIQEKLYKPTKVPFDFHKYYLTSEPMPYEIAEKLFSMQDYEDPPMRGRQSANPLCKLGFAIAREGLDLIKITKLGNEFLEGNYDIGFIFFKSLLKLQFPNPWSEDFSEKRGFDIMPFVATMQLIYRLNKKSLKTGMNKTEFSIFVPTLINADQIDSYIDKILNFREEKDKEAFLDKYLKTFFETDMVSAQKRNSLFDYGDNTMRYFRLTRYFRVKTEPLGQHWIIDLEPMRKEEINQLLELFDGKSNKSLTNIEKYINYISDISQPELPWEEKKNLRKIIFALRKIILEIAEKEKVDIDPKDNEFLFSNISELNKESLEAYISKLRTINLNIKEKIKKRLIKKDESKLIELIGLITEKKKLKKIKPEEFEKIITEAFEVINDEILIKPNYPVDDDGEPIIHAPGNKPDVECYYQTFKAICEVTLNTTKLQWVQEGQPVMRHLRDFEIQNQEKEKEIFCIFIAPHIHNDTYSVFWISVKYEYDGKPQKIIPITTEQFIKILETLLGLIRAGKKFSHINLKLLCNDVINKTKSLSSYSDWLDSIDESIESWKSKVAAT